MEGVDRLLALDAGTEEAMRGAIAADRGLAAAHSALGFALWRLGRPGQAAQAGREACRLAPGATARERSHVAVVAAALSGQPGALDRAEEHLGAFPRDAIVAYLAFFLTGAAGGRAAQQLNAARMGRLGPAYGEDWWFLGLSGYVEAELGHIKAARRLAERSLALRPGHAGAVHSLAHVHYAGGEHLAGAGFLEGWIAGYDPRALYHGHLSWHQALHQLALDDPAAALGLYQRAVSPTVARVRTTFVDATSLLWRIALALGPETELPWGPVASLARSSGPVGGGLVDIHVALAYAGAADVAALGGLARDLGALGPGRRRPSAPVALAMAEGLGHFVSAKWSLAADAVTHAASTLADLDGSDVQLEVVEETAIAACLRAGRKGAAGDLLARRLARRPSPADRRRLAQLVPATSPTPG